ncbi:hypothetical protein [Serratia fonticola]|uniref:hypothetical protein n=1 Tax=Serratia fonticola TaxID=47917 RepID=UPI000E0F5E2C|nr:hypothetical protein [Serratia fonticola]
MVQECAKFHIFLRPTGLTLCIKCQPWEDKKIDVMTSWLANVIENDKNYDEKGELRVLLLCRCIKTGEDTQIGSDHVIGVVLSAFTSHPAA